ncbi:MAG: ATP-dependent Clp protease proteolytic subunit [Paracoccaceae bacterium]|nr:ATP-dependent Clp protease proteolytic subunit [Paracoccaceae bacterium]
MLDRLATPRMTIGKGLKWALIAQAVLAACLVVADIDARWWPRLADQRDLPTGPASPGDQVRHYDPARLQPGFTDRTNMPDIDMPDDMPTRLEFSMIPTDAADQTLLILGMINAGDADRFAAHLASLETPPATIALNSPGGMVSEALAIGRHLRRTEADTVMLPGMVCLSSCPYIFAAGETRRASRDAALGMHQHFYDAPGYMPAFLAVERVQLGQGQTLDYLIEMGIDPGLMRYSLNTPPTDIYLLVEQELLDTRLATEMID